ncbi:SGNH hydrolase-type esterase domain-containing protein [Diplogelasinospora grovesii]|uniref:SGNH hydrolase-type esterase domain-containing protein n=1 Tax=Diplogelasinospora grovesii TaxID=303347 RepID=A0AAN6N537_9PEZI|nr:SGNH hydrolase-type esterase domain-containing protein [Diplogelasinospora grovesii]
MLLKLTLLMAALSVEWIGGTSVDWETRATPTIYLAGDSTMAKLSSPTDGWGQYLNKYVTIPVVNKAIGGRSARSFFNEGRFTEIERLVAPGDIVVIEFGHNDGGSPNSASDNGRSDCPGTEVTTTCKSGKNASETVYTFGYYVETATTNLKAKGASVVISSQTPNNVWEGGKYNAAPSRFVGYAATAAKNAGVGFVDHFQAVANMYLKLGGDQTNALYPKDHTHTSPEGADLSAQAFVEAIARDFNGTTPLKQYLKGGVPVVF